jgi:hypothetical protein
MQTVLRYANTVIRVLHDYNSQVNACIMLIEQLISALQHVSAASCVTNDVKYSFFQHVINNKRHELLNLINNFIVRAKLPTTTLNNVVK